MKYTKAMIEVIDLTAEDVVLTSGGSCTNECQNDTCRADSGEF